MEVCATRDHLLRLAQKRMPPRGIQVRVLLLHKPLSAKSVANSFSAPEDESSLGFLKAGGKLKKRTKRRPSDG